MFDAARIPTIQTAKIGDAQVTPAKTSFFSSNGLNGGVFVGRITGPGGFLRLPAGWDVDKLAANGSYSIIHGFGTTAYAVAATSVATVGSPGDIGTHVRSKGTNAFTLELFRTTTGAGVNSDFDFIVVRH